MIKLLITGLLVYFLYRIITNPARINSAFNDGSVPLDSDLNNNDEDYVDYEEI